MYSVYADGVCIYNDAFALDNMKLASPKLTQIHPSVHLFCKNQVPQNKNPGHYP